MKTRAIVNTLRSTRTALVAGLLALGVMAAPLASQSAFAGIGGCGTDPIVFLSDGTLVDLTASIADTPGDVSQVAYVLHAPAGTSVTRVLYTPKLASKETFVFVADNAPGTYDTDTVVQTGASNVAVTASTAVVSPSFSSQWTYGSGTATGYNGQDLTVHVVVGQ